LGERVAEGLGDAASIEVGLEAFPRLRWRSLFLGNFGDVALIVDAESVLVDFAVFQAESLAANPAGLRKRIDGHNTSPPEVHTQRLGGGCVLRGLESIYGTKICLYGSVLKEVE
jgi:hypothetical protein